MQLVKWMALGVFVTAVGVDPSAQNRLDTDTTAHPLSPDEKGGLEESGPYMVVPGHFKSPFPTGWTWGVVAGILVESPDRIYVYQRGILPALERYWRADGLPARDNTGINNRETELGKSLRREYILTVFDGQGNLIEHWKHLDAMHAEGSQAHRLRRNPWDPEKHVWLIDEGTPSQILKLTRDGKVVMRIGPDQIEHAQDIAFLPNGDFWCVQTRGNDKVIKFSKDGKRLAEFGKNGPGPGELNFGHAITIDSRGRIYIGEGGNSRIQVFDQAGKSLDIWPNIPFGAGSMAIDQRDRLWIADGDAHRIAGFDLSGKLLSHWGVAGMTPGRLYGVSQFDVDSAGNVYMVEVRGGRVQMFRPKKGADPNRLIGQLVQ